MSTQPITYRRLLAATRLLDRSFYERPTIDVAPDLLGKVIVHKLAGQPLAARIVETEAYLGKGDLAAHSTRGKTKSTRVIFGPPGHAYVYLCYGMYECLNLITKPDGQAGCVLIRAVEPLVGIEEIQRRRPNAQRLRDLASGPGKLTLALGVTRLRNEADVTRGALTVRAMHRPKPIKIVTTTRIGISASRDLPCRFYIKDNEFVTKS
ncbi:MAG: DNA-3-methyladenine glycosylase [Bryobacterales bacterium]|nr:DNA-3-methyladenine glycosylase [Bryobacterales bacterium]